MSLKVETPTAKDGVTVPEEIQLQLEDLANKIRLTYVDYIMNNPNTPLVVPYEAFLNALINFSIISGIPEEIIHEGVSLLYKKHNKTYMNSLSSFFKKE